VLFDTIAYEWAEGAVLDPNLCRYSLRGVSNQLYNSSWEFHVKKEGESMVCQFLKRQDNASNGDFLSP
jgi:hypothetical protein